MESLLRTGHIWLIDCPAHHSVAADGGKAFHQCKKWVLHFAKELCCDIVKKLVKIGFPEIFVKVQRRHISPLTIIIPNTPLRLTTYYTLAHMTWGEGDCNIACSNVKLEDGHYVILLIL